jgi:hypothetical protein
MVYSFGFYKISKKNFQKKNFSKIFKKSNFGALYKAPESFLSKNILASPPYYNPRAIQKKKKLKFSPSVFFLLTAS